MISSFESCVTAFLEMLVMKTLHKDHSQLIRSDNHTAVKMFPPWLERSQNFSDIQHEATSNSIISVPNNPSYEFEL